jgi:hypothetical protein
MNLREKVLFLGLMLIGTLGLNWALGGPYAWLPYGMVVFMVLLAGTGDNGSDWDASRRGPDVNPATGLPMVDRDSVDVQGNPYGSHLR